MAFAIVSVWVKDRKISISFQIPRFGEQKSLSRLKARDPVDRISFSSRGTRLKENNSQSRLKIQKKFSPEPATWRPIISVFVFVFVSTDLPLVNAWPARHGNRTNGCGRSKSGDWSNQRIPEGELSENRHANSKKSSEWGSLCPGNTAGRSGCEMSGKGHGQADTVLPDKSSV